MQHWRYEKAGQAYEGSGNAEPVLIMLVCDQRSLYQGRKWKCLQPRNSVDAAPFVRNNGHHWAARNTHYIRGEGSPLTLINGVLSENSVQ